MTLIIWYEILNIVNLVNKQVQSKDIFIYVPMEKKIKGFIFLRNIKKLDF